MPVLNDFFGILSLDLVKVIKISLQKGNTGMTSASPSFTYSALKTQLITNGFTSKITTTNGEGGTPDTFRFGTHFTDKGTVLDVSQVCSFM